MKWNWVGGHHDRYAAVGLAPQGTLAVVRGVARRLGVTRRGALGLIFGASSLIYAAGTALASSSAVATPGESVTIKTNRR